MLHELTRGRWLFPVLLVVLGAVAITARAIAAGPAPSLLESVDADDLRRGGIELRQPSSPDLSVATVSRTDAERLALDKAGGGSVIEAKLLVATDTFANNGLTCLCWVISSHPDGGPYIHQPIPWDESAAKTRVVADRWYHLDFVDARTGKWLYGAEHANTHEETVKEAP